MKKEKHNEKRKDVKDKMITFRISEEKKKRTRFLHGKKLSKMFEEWLDNLNKNLE